MSAKGAGAAGMPETTEMVVRGEGENAPCQKRLLGTSTVLAVGTLLGVR